MNNIYAVIIDNYIIINEQERINLKNKKAKVLNELDNRVDLEINGKVYNLPISIIRKYNNFDNQKVYQLLK